METKRLYRSRHNHILAGVFGGLGQYLGVDAVLLRLIWLFVVVFTGFIPGIIFYLFAMLVIPKETE